MVHWRKVLIAQALVLTCLFGAACSEGNDGVKKRVLYESAHEGADLQQKLVEVAFGDWVARCKYLKWKKPNNREEAECEVKPWNGERLNGGSAKNLLNKAVVKITRDGNPQLRINVQALAFELRCGTAKVAADRANSKVLFNDDVTPFLSEMPHSDCELEFTPRGATAPTVQKISRRGFAEALDYAQSFVRGAR